MKSFLIVLSIAAASDNWPQFRGPGALGVVEDEVTLATPAIARGSLLIRTASSLYRISRSSPTAK